EASHSVVLCLNGESSPPSVILLIALMLVLALGRQPRLDPVGLPARVVHNVRVPERRQFTGGRFRRVSGGARTVDDDLRALVGQKLWREFAHAVGREVDR